MRTWKAWLGIAFATLAACSADTGAVDSGVPTDTGIVEDTSPPVDNPPPKDTGVPEDRNQPEDVPTPVDVPTPEDNPPPDTGPMCNAGELVCGGACVNVQTSSLHCGMCDRACGTNETCMAGTCRSTVTCMGTQTACGGGCVDTMTDNSHCGMCDRACPSGQRCMGGACMAERMCPMGQSDCSGTCVDTQTSAAHCGACGNACPAGQGCITGVCQPATCPMGQTRCPPATGACVDTRIDPAHCGRCENACMASETCMAGACRSACAAPRMSCTVGGTTLCVDVTSDEANCGRCGMACAAGERCMAGACRSSCAAPRMTCTVGGMMRCVDVQTDPANCGRCGMACGMGQSCSGGMCRCPSGRTACGTACVDTGSDAANCGRCGMRCAGTSTCSMGMCSSLCGTGTTSCGGRCVATSTFLTDRNNCGRCGNRCATGTNCVLGSCRPVNDERAAAITIAPDPAREVTVTGTTEGATHDGPTVPCLCTSGGNVWYRFTVPAPGGVVYFDTAGSMYDTSLFLTSATGAALPGQSASGFDQAGLCNDDARCGTGGGFTSNLQSRTAGVLDAGTYFVAVGGCGSGSFTLHLQYVPRNVARGFRTARLVGTGTTASQSLGMGSVTASTTCGGASGAELAQWFLVCGATMDRQLFSTCRSDPGASFTRRTSFFGGTTFDPVMYVRNAQNGMQVSCNDDGLSQGATDCRGTVPASPIGGTNLDSLQRGSRLNGLSVARGVGTVFVDTLGESNGMRFTMYFQIP